MCPENGFPAVVSMIMAVETIYQSSEVRSQPEGKTLIKNPQYRLRIVTFDKALVLDEGKDHENMLTLAPISRGRIDWHEFIIFTLNDSVWQEYSCALVRIEEEAEIKHLKPYVNL